MGKLIASTGLIMSLLASSRAAPVLGEIQVDLDGDGIAEIVSLSQRPDQVMLFIQGPAVNSGTQTLSFGVDPARQDAVCGLPVVLEITSPDCKPEALGDETLDGCEAKPLSNDITLSDGMCDSIHLYWNHDKRQLGWWRL